MAAVGCNAPNVSGIVSGFDARIIADRDTGKWLGHTRIAAEVRHRSLRQVLHVITARQREYSARNIKLSARRRSEESVGAIYSKICAGNTRDAKRVYGARSGVKHEDLAGSRI